MEASHPQGCSLGYQLAVCWLMWSDFISHINPFAGCSSTSTDLQAYIWMTFTILPPFQATQRLCQVWFQRNHFISLVTRQLSILKDWFNGGINLNQVQLFGRTSVDLQELKLLITPFPNNGFVITHIKSGLLLYFTQRLTQADTAVCN